MTVNTLPNGGLTRAYSARLTAEPGKALQWTASGLPAGIRCVNGELVGTPTRKGNYTVKLTLKNAGGTDTKTFSVQIVDKDEAIPGATENEAQKEPEAESEPEIESAPDDLMALGDDRDTTALTVDELALVSNDELVIAAILPEVSVAADGEYAFAVSLDKAVPVGSELVWFSFPKDGADVEDIATFIDTDGAEILAVPDGHDVAVQAYLKAGVYGPVIAAKVSHADVGALEVITATADAPAEAGSGCDAGMLGLVGLGIAALASVKKRYRQ